MIDIKKIRDAAGLRNYKERYIIWGIFILAFIIRILYLNQIKNTPFFGCLQLDPLYYDIWAEKLLKIGWVDSSVFCGSPLYLYFLAAVYKVFGHNIFLATLIQHVLGAFSCVIIYLIGKKIFSRAIGIIAGLIMSAYSVFIFHEGILSPDSMALFLISLATLSLLYAVEKPGFKAFFFSGLLWGLSVFTRANILPLVILVWIFAVFKEKKKAAIFILAFISGIAVISAPITIKNFLMTGEFVIVAHHGGENFYIGNNPDSDGRNKQPSFVNPTPFREHEDFRREAGRITGESLSYPQSSRFWFREGLCFIKANPSQFLELLFKKSRYFFFSRYEAPDNDSSFYFFKRYSGLLNMLDFGFIAPWCLFGMMLALKDFKKLSLIYFIVLSYSVSIIIFFVISRYRLPVVQFFILFASYGIYWMFDQARKRRFRRLLSCAVILGALSFLINKEDIKPDFSQDYLSLGSAYLRKEQYNDSLEAYKKSLFLNYKHASFAYSGMGNVFYARKLYNQALFMYTKALLLDLDCAEYHFNIGTVYYKQGLWSNALLKFKRAIELNAFYPEAHYNLGMVYYKKRLYEEAIHEFKEAVKIDPGHIKAGYAINLADKERLPR